MATLHPEADVNERQAVTLNRYRVLIPALDGMKLKEPPPLFAQMRNQLHAAVTRIDALHKDRLSAETLLAGRPLTIFKEEVRRKQMLPLARVARALLKFSPAESAVWKLPHARADARTVGKQGLAMCKALKPHRKLLTAAGFSTEFMATLERDAQRLIKGESRAVTGRSLRSRATREMTAQFKKATQAIRVLDGLILHHAPDIHGQFMTHTRVGKKIGRPRKKRRRQMTAAPPVLSA
jgi:hypothetical protein